MTMRSEQLIQTALLFATIILMVIATVFIFSEPSTQATIPKPVIKVDPPVTADPTAKLFFERPMIRSN